MRPLHPPLKVIEEHLFMPSENLLLRWVNNDKTLSQKQISALEKNPLAREFYADFHKSDETIINNVTSVSSMPAFLDDLIVQRIAAQKSYAAVSVASSGQVVLIDYDLANPFLVLINKRTKIKNVWSGWIVASETDYASYWDMLLEPEDEPFDPLAGMIQVWNPVSVYLSSDVSVLAKLKPKRLDAVRALEREFVSGVEPDDSLCQMGRIAPRSTVGGYSVLTGTPISSGDDPRRSYRNLYLRAAELLPKVEIETNNYWISDIYQKFKNYISSLEMVWLIPITAIVVLVISLTIFLPTNDRTFETIYANKTEEMELGLREFQFEWETTNVFAFSGSTTARKAFRAGLLSGREALLGETNFDNWSKTEWKNDFELGRWIFLLWTACEFKLQMPATFWDEQRKFLEQFKDNRVFIQFENQIKDFLAMPIGKCDNLKPIMN